MTDDLISRQVAIDALCAVCGKACDKSKFVYNAPQDEQVILCPEHYCLCTLPSAQPEQRWIPCSERLPEDDREVLACSGKDVFIAHCEGEYWAVYLLNTEDDCYEQHVVKVTHWMPLPEPPKMEKKHE